MYINHVICHVNPVDTCTKSRQEREREGHRHCSKSDGDIAIVLAAMSSSPTITHIDFHAISTRACGVDKGPRLVTW